MKNLSLFTIFFIVLGCGYFMKSYTWNNDRWRETLNPYDPTGYYFYLPGIFIKHDLTITDSTLLYTNMVGKQIADKYFIGAAVLWSPFFMATLEYSRLFRNHTDVYSHLFIRAIGIAALFWLFVGLFCLRKILKYFNISEPVISLTLFMIFFGTNLAYYSYEQYMMVHLYSFSMLCVFLYAGIKYANSGKSFFLVLTSAAFALCVLIRPTSICVLPCLLPLMCGDLKKTFRVFFSPKPFIIAFSIVVPILFIQCIAWHMETGHWFVRAYSSEGFYFLHPKILRVLFSFHSGFFIYTPLALVSLFGFINVYRVNKVAFYCCSLVIIIWTYLVASWWCWSYQDGFEHRAFIDIYPVIAIGMAHLFPSVRNGIYASVSPFKRNIITAGLLFTFSLFLSLNQIQTYQYYNSILSADMNWDSYKYIFLKTSNKYVNCLGGCRDIQPYSRKPPLLVYSSTLNIMHPGKEWQCIAPEILNGKPVIHFNKENDYGVCLRVLPSDSFYNKGEAYCTKVVLTRFEPRGNSSKGALFVNDIQDAKGNHEFYRSFMINDCPSGNDSNTHTYYYIMATPSLMHKDSKMAFYIWNQGRGDFYLTGLSVSIYRCFQ